MAEERPYSAVAVAVAVKLLITSVDCDAKAELTFSDHQTPMRWNAIVDALNLANYSLAMRRLADPPTRTRVVAFLGVNASKKVAFLHSGDSERENRDHLHYQITYDENLMNELPSFNNLKGLPRFHLFTELPEDLQLRIIVRLDGADFSRMRRVSRQFRRLSWSRDFNICKYLNPDMKAARPNKVVYFLDFQILLRFAAPVFLVVVAVAPSFGFWSKVMKNNYAAINALF